MKNSIITFIGGGNMATSLIGGLLQTGVTADNIRVADINSQALAHALPIQRYSNNLQAISGAHVVVLAIKPQQLPEVTQEIATVLSSPLPLFVSIAAGIRLADLARWLGADKAVPIVRVMPNTPAFVQSSASVLVAGAHVNQTQRELAENILRAVGLALWIEDESLMDTITALSGSGPAYFLLIMELLEKIAIDLGLPQETARLLTLQTAFGTAKMALESQEDVAILRARVTSKGGTTEAAINTLLSSDIQSLFEQALQAARQRAIELANQFGEQ
ncbi:MAG: pyrroline-5-carboxylate reductase [Pseudomonadota bacterium]|nr:pyrroline-5-carboxylate reductase [Pseudomonadota bacterium]